MDKPPESWIGNPLHDADMLAREWRAPSRDPDLWGPTVAVRFTAVTHRFGQSHYRMAGRPSNLSPIAVRRLFGYAEHPPERPFSLSAPNRTMRPL